MYLYGWPVGSMSMDVSVGFTLGFGWLVALLAW